MFCLFLRTSYNRWGSISPFWHGKSSSDPGPVKRWPVQMTSLKNSDQTTNLAWHQKTSRRNEKLSHQFPKEKDWHSDQEITNLYSQPTQGKSKKIEVAQRLSIHLKNEKTARAISHRDRGRPQWHGVMGAETRGRYQDSACFASPEQGVGTHQDRRKDIPP